MGAADTNIAKPWRREIYLQDDALPHPVHAARAGAHRRRQHRARPAARHAASCAGYMPDFALIEGTAVAAAWANSAALGPDAAPVDARDARARHHARAARGVRRRLPRAAATPRIHAERLAVALHRRDSAARPRCAASTQRRRRGRARHRSCPSSSGSFARTCSTVELPDSALALAKQRFAGSSILSSVCPHVKAELRAGARGRPRGRRHAEAAARVRAPARDRSGRDQVRATLVGVLARRGDMAGAERELTRCWPAGRRRAGDRERAPGARRRGLAQRPATIAPRRSTANCSPQPNERDALRMLQVKSLGARRFGAPARAAVRAAVGEPGPADRRRDRRVSRARAARRAQRRPAATTSRRASW